LVAVLHNDVLKANQGQRLAESVSQWVVYILVTTFSFYVMK